MTKTKSRHHKSENTHKFLTLNERLANIHVDISKRINRYASLKPEETETYFYQALAKWVDLNYTAVFHEFTIKVKRQCQTLAMVIYHKQQLVDTLIEYIGKSDELSLQPVLDLTVQLSRDLQQDFYPFFPSFFNAIVRLLNQETTIIEWAFQTLSYLFKFLWRYMLKDLNNVYELYSPLFDQSRKQYIRNFAAESFAFIMRKVEDKNELFNFLVTRIENNPHEKEGIGRLIFEMFRGIKQGFNACTKQTWTLGLNYLSKNDYVLDCFTETVKTMAHYTNKQHTEVIWSCFYTQIDLFTKNNETKKLIDLLQLILVYLNERGCYLVDKLDLLIENLCKVAAIERSEGKEELFKELTDVFMNIGHSLLLSNNVVFSIEKNNLLPSKLYQNKYDLNAIVELTKTLFDHSLFENLILPHVISYFEYHVTNSSDNKQYLQSFIHLISEYLTKHKKIITLESAVNLTDFESLIKEKDLHQIVRIFEDKQKFRSFNLYSKLADYLSESLTKSETDKDHIIEVLISTPFVCKELLLSVKNYINILLKRLSESSTADYRNTYTLSIAIWSLIMFKDSNVYFTMDDSSPDELSLQTLVNLFVKNESCSNLLRSLTYYIRKIPKPLSKIKKCFDTFYPIIKIHLSSGYHENRLNTLIILDAYYSEYFPQSADTEKASLFETSLKAEQIPASIDDYREKLLYLQRLEPTAIEWCFNKLNTEAGLTNPEEIPLRHLFGVLFENFKLLWDPVITTIQSYASYLKSNQFWDIFSHYLTSLSNKIESRSIDDENSNENNLFMNNDPSSMNIDYMNNRLLMCQAMQGFASSCESKTKFLVPLFFRFINNEYYKEENRLLSTAYEDITKKSDSNASAKKNSSSDLLPNKKERYHNKALLNKHLCAFLDIFSQFTSPKSWHQEENLRNLYLNLLCHHEATVQKSALNCIFTYNYEFIKPYKDHLTRLIDNKHFRHELVVFSLDESNGVIHSDHRQKLLPILMRLLYGKFHSHETTHTSSRDSKTNKRSTIIQFLSSCNQYELNYFFNLIFDCLNVVICSGSESQDRFEFNDNDDDEATRDASLAKIQKWFQDNSQNATKIIPLKKILGILQSLDIIMKKLARQMENFSHRILKMICFIHKYALNLAASSENIDEYYLNLLKITRQQVTLRFKQFFDTFDHLNFSQHEYYFIFESFIWPQAQKLGTDSLKSISNLLKIFQLWSERAKYYPLFILKRDDFDLVKVEGSLDIYREKNILDIVFSLVDSNKCSQLVIDYVLEMIYNLVSFADFKPEENTAQADTKPLPFSTDSIIENHKTDDLNIGTIILKPYVSSIVNHIEKIVVQNMSKKSLPTKPLKILARLSCFATNSQQQCEKIILLLIPYLIKNRKQTEENEINILNSINHLIKQVKDVSEFICPVSRLFCVIKNRQSRVELCNVFKSIAEIQPNYEQMSQLVNDINSWDPKRIEEPDYILRLDAFKILNEIVDKWTTFDMKFASILIYNCVFFLNNIEDLAIKESSTNSIKLFLIKSSNLELTKQDKNLLESNFVSEIKNGLRNKSESARHEFINLLIEFIKSFSSTFTSYSDMTCLFDKEDIEKDFYENIKHIQMHRRSRALKRLQRACEEGQISADNLLAFMMPIVRSFLDNEMYHKYDHLIEESCHSIGSICYVLAWPKYLKIVEYYMKILTKNILTQKLVIKILVNVLDAFHYDLSLSKMKDYYSETKADEADEPEIGTIEELSEPTAEETEPSPPGRKKKLVGSAMATRIHSTITKSIIPMLFKCLTKRLTSDSEHKINKHENEDEQILRVPMALAILKLLNNLPSKTLQTHLPGLLYKVCEMLKSRAISVRNTTRDCLMKMIDSLPSKNYYFYVFKELSNSLTKGYQVHVLCFTIQLILKNVKDKLVVGDLDSSLGILLNSVNLELFSSVSDEKEVKQIVAKIMEAKTVSSYNTLELLGKFVSQTSLVELLKPFKEQLDTCNSRKLLKKIEEALRRVLLGILTNTSLTVENLMYLVYGLVNDTLSALKNPSRQSSKRLKLTNDEEEKYLNNTSANDDMHKSCLIIPVEPKRGGDKPKVQAKTNQHVIVEFALQLLNNLIKQNRIVPQHENGQKYTQMLDPYLPIFIDYLDGKYLKVTIITLRCLTGFLRFPLPSLPKYSKQMATKLFSLLRTYSTASTTATDGERGDNFELLMVCYKLIATLIRDCESFNLDEDQLQVLLHYAERNLYDNHKQASAFNLLKSILARKLKCDELNDVLGKVMKLSIQADSANVRLQSRQTILQYMLEYSLSERKLVKLIEFYIVQLDYDYENGRESALEMLATIFNSFPTAQLNQYAPLFYLPLGIQLHNDDSAKCKKLASLAIKSLLEKISIEQKDSLFKLTVALYDDNERALHKRIATLLVKIFIESEKEQFIRRLDDSFLNTILNEIDSNNIAMSMDSNTNSNLTEKFYDQYLYNLLSLVMKILNECKIINDKKFNQKINQIFDHVRVHLTHDHSWVRLISCQLFGFLFANQTADDLMKNSDSFFNYSTKIPFLKLRDVIDSLSIQLKSPILDNELAEQIVKNLAFFSKLLIKYEYNQSEEIEEIKHNMNIEWLIKKIIKEAKYELVNKPQETIKRTFIFKWLAALSLQLGKEKLTNYLELIIPTIQREIVVGQTDEALKKLAQECLEIIKQIIGVEEFSMIYSKSNKKRAENQEERKRKVAQLAIIDPQLAAQKKIRRMQRKKEAKKRKLTSKSKNGTEMRRKKMKTTDDDNF